MQTVHLKLCIALFHQTTLQATVPPLFPPCRHLPHFRGHTRSVDGFGKFGLVGAVSKGARRLHADERRDNRPPLRGKANRRRDRLEWVNRPQAVAGMLAVAHAIKHNRPYRVPSWAATVEKVSLLVLGTEIEQ
jgi:hypothetical protein